MLGQTSLSVKVDHCTRTKTFAVSVCYSYPFGITKKKTKRKNNILLSFDFYLSLTNIIHVPIVYANKQHNVNITLNVYNDIGRKSPKKIRAIEKCNDQVYRDNVIRLVK